MLALAANTSGVLTPFLVSLAAITGVFGAIVAVVKLRGDTQTAAVSQAQGANEAMRETLEAVERDRDYWQRRYEREHQRANDLAAELAVYRIGGTP